jgi:protein archease
MPYRFLPDVALADIAFEAVSTSVNGLFADCALALSDIMVDPKSVRPNVSKDFALASVDLDRLLYDFLTEMIIAKDVESMLFTRAEVQVASDGKSLKAVLRGEPIDRKRHGLRNDVKAVTMHMFGIRREGDEWRATVVLDI